MNPIYLLIVGLTIVIGGILVFRLHAILALFIGALVVSFLTPDFLLEKYALGSNLSVAETARLLDQTAGERIAVAFGHAAQSIVVLIVLASIMGKRFQAFSLNERQRILDHLQDERFYGRGNSKKFFHPALHHGRLWTYRVHTTRRFISHGMKVRANEKDC